MGKSQELATQLPSEKQIVRRFGDSIAKSPKDIKPGQVVMVSRAGVAFGRPRFTRLLYAWKIGIYGALIGGGVLAISGGWVAGSLLYLAGMTPTLIAKYRGSGTLMSIEILVREGHLDEGQRRLEAVPRLRRRNPVFYCWLSGNCASHRGDHAAALRWWREAFPRAKGLQQEMLKLSITAALLLDGRLEEARREFASVILPLEADEVLMGKSFTQIMFALCDPSSEPMPEEDLHDRASRALEYSHTGAEIAAIGWAFERRGDQDMARFLAGEARDRMHYPYLATWWPALQQWLDAHAPAGQELPAVD